MSTRTTEACPVAFWMIEAKDEQGSWKPSAFGGSAAEGVAVRCAESLSKEFRREYRARRVDR